MWSWNGIELNLVEPMEFESTSDEETKEFCGATWPSRELKRKGGNPYGFNAFKCFNQMVPISCLNRHRTHKKVSFLLYQLRAIMQG
jgi:hypothetical protein